MLNNPRSAPGVCKPLKPTGRFKPCWIRSRSCLHASTMRSSLMSRQAGLDSSRWISASDAFSSFRRASCRARICRSTSRAPIGSAIFSSRCRNRCSMAKVVACSWGSNAISCARSLTLSMSCQAAAGTTGCPCSRHDTATASATMDATITTHCTTWVQVMARMPPRKEHSRMPPSAKNMPSSKVRPDSMEVTRPMP